MFWQAKANDFEREKQDVKRGKPAFHGLQKREGEKKKPGRQTRRLLGAEFDKKKRNISTAKDGRMWGLILL